MGTKPLLLIYNARIFTNNPAEPEVSALAIQNGSVIATGVEAELLSRSELRVSRIDLAGHIVLPGLVDSHLHLEHYALALEKINCETDTLAACLERVKDRARETPKGQWLTGHGWNQNVWVEGFGNADALDQSAPDHPVYLTAKSLHAGWANRAALNLAGIVKDTPDPKDGEIQRQADGTPTGILFESAMNLVERALPALNDTQTSKVIEKAIPTLWQMGLTGVHDFDQRLCFSALQILDESNRLKLRVVKSIPGENLANAAALGLRTGFGSPYLKIGAVKLFADGALGPQTAAMIHPYEGNPGSKGMLFIDGEELFEIGQQAARGGLSLAVHAIGDRATHEILNGFQRLRKFEKNHDLPALRHRIEHVQVLKPEDQRRLGSLNIIASMQPIHATSDMEIAERYLGRRSGHAYTYASILQSNAHVAFGSDAPVESPNPFWGIHAAVTRRRQDGSPGKDGWHPIQKISLQQAIHAYTTGPAYASGLEKTHGQLAPGFVADLIVMKENPFLVDEMNLYQLKPTATMIGGEWVWRNLF